MKTHFLAVVAAILGAASLSADDFIGSRESAFKESSYDFRLMKSAIAAAPSWLAGAESPPLSPRKAHEIALAQAQKLRPEVTTWRPDDIRLEPVAGGNAGTYLEAGWIYVVTLLDFSGPIGGVPWQLEIPVYLDGSTISPVITKRKRP